MINFIADNPDDFSSKDLRALNDAFDIIKIAHPGVELAIIVEELTNAFVRPDNSSTALISRTRFAN